MTTTQWTAGSLLVIALSHASPVAAQGGNVFFEAGTAKGAFGNGVHEDGVSIGAGITNQFGGNSGKDFGIGVPFWFEMRVQNAMGDFMAGSELAMRVHNVAFGPGAAVGYAAFADLGDPRCVSGPAALRASCAGGPNEGLRNLGKLTLIGATGFMKATFGPQGRAFVQGRFLAFPGLTLKGGLKDASGQTTEHPADFPDPDSAREFRVSTGYVFGSVGHVAKIVRVQYSDVRLDYTRVRANDNGMFNVHVQQFTVGVAIGFRMPQQKEP